MKNTNAASSKILIISVAVLILVLLAGGYYYWKISNEAPAVNTNVNVETTDQRPAQNKTNSNVVGNIYRPRVAPVATQENGQPAPVSSPTQPIRDLQDLSVPSLVNMTLTEATATQIKGASVFNKKDSYYFNLNSKTEVFFYQPPQLNSDRTYVPAVYVAKKISDLKKGQRVSVRYDKSVKPYEAARVEILDNL